MEGSYTRKGKGGYVNEKFIAEAVAGWLAIKGWKMILYT